MSRYLETDTPSGVLGMTMEDGKVYITSHRGRDVELNIPACTDLFGEKLPVTCIGRKAFLSDKYLNRIILPDSVDTIEEWAFAGCRGLERISVHRGIKAANGAFKDCVKLKEVELRGGTQVSADVGYLLAAVIRLMDDRYLFDLQNAGTADWIANWDMRMDSILSEPDEEGFSALLACGEEDYEGRDNTPEAYLTRRRSRKVRICMIRLLHDYGLSKDRRERISSYIYEHRAGTESPESWQVVLNEHGDEEEYYALLNECGCIDPSNIDKMLGDLGEMHPGMKAYLLRLHTQLPGESFLDSMSF